MKKILDGGKKYTGASKKIEYHEKKIFCNLFQKVKLSYIFYIHNM